MNSPFLIIPVALAAGFAIYWFVFRKKASSGSGPLPASVLSTAANTIQTTASGVQVATAKGVAQSTLDAVERGWVQVRADAVASGYTEKLDATEYRVYIQQACVPSPKQQIPSFLVRADNYDGTSFDQYNPKGPGVKDGVGYVYAAEMVLDYGIGGPFPSQAQIIACEGEAENAFRYGCEHVLAAHNDSLYASQTQTHAEGTGHPILPQPAPYNPTKFVNGVSVPR